MRAGDAADLTWSLDHLVVAAATLEAGVAWCERSFGVAPGPGGKHVFMGTHNRLLAVACPMFPRAYLELIAVDPDGAAPARPRWFDLDDPALRESIAAAPRLVHWVARCAALDAECAALRESGHDPGVPIAAERETPQGMLRWRISVRPDGRRLAAGALPTLIEWGARHPADGVAPSGVALGSLRLGALPAVAAARLPAGVTVGATGPALDAQFVTPRGRVRITS